MIDVYSDDIIRKYSPVKGEITDTHRSLCKNYRPFCIFKGDEVVSISDSEDYETVIFNMSWEGCIKHILDNNLEDVRVSPVYLYG